MSEIAIPAPHGRSPVLSNGAHHRAAGSRYIQALRTYNRPLPIAIALLLFLVFLYPVCHTQQVIQFACAGAACMNAAVLAMFVIFQLRYQLDAPRSTLTPGFRAPHLVAVAAIVLAINVATPLAVSLLAGLSFPTLFACALLTTAILAWTCYEPFGVMLAITLLFNLLPHDPTLPTTETRLAPSVSIAGISSAVVLLAALFAIYARLNGESPSQPVSSRPLTLRIRPRMHDGRINFPLGPITRLFGTLLFFLQTRLEILLQRRRAPSSLSINSSFLARANHRRRATFFGLSPALFAIVLNVTIVILYFAGTWGTTTTNSAEDAFFFFFFPAVLWIVMTGAFWPKQWLYLPAESLLPAPRPRFVRELGAAFALDSLSFWIASSAAALVSSTLLFPHVYTSQLARSAECCLVIGAIFVFCFGLFTWTMLFRNAFLSGIAVLIPIAAFIFSISNMADPHAPSLPFLPTCIGFTSAGVILGARAYHRWCRADIS